MLSNSKITRLVAAAVGLTMAFTMIVGVGVSAVGAQGMTLAQLVDLLIATGVISPDKAAAARAAVAGTTTTTTTTTGGYTFAKDLQVGSRGADVTALQQMIGVNPATGYFGAITKAAVVKFQKDNGITPAVGYVGPITRSALNKVGGTTTTTTTGGTTVVVPAGTTMSVSLSATSPASTAVVAGQAIANLAEYNFVNSSDVAAVVTNVTLNRTGVTDDTTLTNVYLFDGASRVTDAATVSSGKITFNAGSGLFTIPARTAKTISVKADIKAATNGQIVGVSLTGVSSNVPVSASFPINGATFSVALGTMAGLSFNTTTSPAADNASLDPQNDFVMWENTTSVTTRDIYLKTLSLKMIGSVSASDLGNFRLFVDGILVATLSSVDANNYLTFNLSGSPVKLATGNRVIKVLGDVIGGSNKTFSFHLRQVSDVMAIDSQLNQPVLATANSTTFSDRTTGTQTIGVGSVTITKKADSPSGNITLGASNAVLGKFELKAAGEPVKIENLRIGIVSGTDLVGSLRNGSLYVDGVQVGSTQTIATTTGATQYTEFSLGSAVVVTPGTTKILEIKADLYDNDGTDSLASGSTVTARILAGSSNVLRMNALSYTANTLTDGNALTVSVGAMSLSKYASYGNQTTVVPQNNGYKIGSFVLTSSNGSEAISLNTLAVGIRANATTDGLVADMSNIYVKYGDGLSLVTPVKATVSATSTWTINTSLAAGASIPVEIWANLSSSLLSASTTVTYVKIDGQTVGSSQSKSAEALGQIITVQTGDISAAAVNDTSVATRLVVGGNTVKVASYRITSLYDSYTIKNVAVKTTETANAPAAISAVVFKNNGVQLGNQITVDSVSGIATSSDITLLVPANDPNGKVIDIYAVLNSVGPGAATTTANVALSLEGFKYETSGGTPGEYATDKTSNATYVVKSIPTLTNMLAEGTLTSGTSKTIASFKVSADAAGQINWKKVQFAINKTAAVTLGATSTMKLYDSNHNSIDGVFSTTTGSLVSVDSFLGLTSGTLTFVATNEQEVTNSATYTLETTVGGIDTGYNYVNVNIPVAATAIATPRLYSTLAGATGSFIWSDRSSVSGAVHSESTADWLNDYKVLGIPTNSATLSVTI